ncbi:MAG: N-acetylmuramoyl-L-alanine amidase [Planctomycetes bacterium]|nr:N-acetylmuramoyl-L-alanine amidase [Planctomycetota bacterium]
MVGITLAGCAGGAQPGEPLERSGDEICAAGRLFHTGTRVVLWLDPGGYDAYRPHRWFQPGLAGPAEAPDRIARYDSVRKRLPEDLAERVRHRGWTLEDLQRVVRQVVVHFDACGTSRRCFEVLHDVRGLSCHFLLDLDGTIYQTLDLKERAWHAAQANEGSVGIEIANIGAHSDPAPLAAWYGADEEGVRVTLPREMGDGGLPPGFVARPRRPDPIRGRVQGKDLVQYDFTEEQYRALEKLLVALCRVFPEIKARVPRDRHGGLLRQAFGSEEDLQRFQGLVAHWHVTREKVDPGPAFDWARVLEALQRAGVPED